MDKIDELITDLVRKVSNFGKDCYCEGDYMQQQSEIDDVRAALRAEYERMAKGNEKLKTLCDAHGIGVNGCCVSIYAKMKDALSLAKEAGVGCSFSHIEVIELLGYIKSLEESIGLAQTEIENFAKGEVKE